MLTLLLFLLAPGVQPAAEARQDDPEMAVASYVVRGGWERPVAFDRSASTPDRRGHLRTMKRASRIAAVLDSASVVGRGILHCAHAGCTFGSFRTYVRMSVPRAIDDSTVRINVLVMRRTAGATHLHSRSEQEYCVTHGQVTPCGRRSQT